MNVLLVVFAVLGALVTLATVIVAGCVTWAYFDNARRVKKSEQDEVRAALAEASKIVAGPGRGGDEGCAV